MTMLLLALDTSTECCSAALLQGETLSLRHELTERSHAELLLPMIDALLRDAGVAPRALGAIAFGCGPGAFTGLRIAAGVTQGLAFALGCPVVPVSSLAAVAFQVDAREAEPILVCNDARMGEVYWAEFERRAQGLHARLPARVSAPAIVATHTPRARHAAGNALLRHPELRTLLQSAGLRIHDGLLPRADAVARLGMLELAAGRALAAAEALPHYVRDEVAGRVVTPV